MTDDLQNLLAAMVKRMKFVGARNSMWNGQDGYQIGWNHDDRYRVKLDGKVILKEIVGFDRAIAWANEHRTARIASALNLDAVLALVAANWTEGYNRGISSMLSSDPAVAFSGPTPPPNATAALARMLADARAEGLEMALEAVNGQFARLLYFNRDTENNLTDKVEEGYGNALVNCAAAIRAMKGEQG